MITRTLLCALLLVACGVTVAPAAQDASYTGVESAAEKLFVVTVQADLMKRFAVATDAEAAGYVRYTGIDDSGAISYANREWQSTDRKHPSQLWYDAKGRLLGADYSVLMSGSKSRPSLWGVNPGRWAGLDGHIHWVTKDASGTSRYDLWMRDAKFTAAGGNPAHPTAADLVTMHKVTSAADVSTVFHFPPIWDLTVWVKPNRNGAFADKNPDVAP